MTEKEKMLAGKIYDPFSEGMPEERAKAHLLCSKYNKTTELNEVKRRKILRKLIPNCGNNVYLQGPIYFDFGKNIAIGDNSYANFNFTVLDEGKVNIGENVFIGPNVSIFTPIHPLCHQDRNLFFNKKTGKTTNLERSGNVKIEKNCWICGNVTILANVTIGEGCVIGAGSVVSKDIPPNSLAVGVPCKVIRQITEKDRLSNHPEYF